MPSSNKRQSKAGPARTARARGTAGRRQTSLLGVIHLPPLPGAPGGLSPGQGPSLPAFDALQRAGAWAVAEARLLARAGFDGFVIENFGDAPFYPDRVPAETVAAMGIIALAVRDEFAKHEVAINVLRNDAASALAIAGVSGCDWVRINVLSGVAATDQGLIAGRAHEWLRERARLGAESVQIAADVHVKHAVTLSSHSLELAVEETIGRGGARAVIITGPTTGRAPELDALKRAAHSAHAAGGECWVGSGATAASVASLLKIADRVVVGSALRRGGRAGAPLDSRRVNDFVRAARGRRG